MTKNLVDSILLQNVLLINVPFSSCIVFFSIEQASLAASLARAPEFRLGHLQTSSSAIAERPSCRVG